MVLVFGCGCGCGDLLSGFSFGGVCGFVCMACRGLWGGPSPYQPSPRGTDQRNNHLPTNKLKQLEKEGLVAYLLLNTITPTRINRNNPPT